MSKKAIIGKALIGHQIPEEYTGKEIISGFLSPTDVLFIVGEPTSGKSLLTVHLAACLATGRRFVEFDSNNPPENEQHGLPICKGSMLYLAGEGHRGLPKRIRAATEALQAHFGSDVLKLFGEHLPIITLPVSNLTESDLPEIEDKIGNAKALLESEGFPLLAIVVDTLYATCSMADDSDNIEMQTLVDWLRDYAKRINCLLVLITHPPRNPKAPKGSIRGAGSFQGTADIIWHTGKVKGHPNRRRLTITKRKDGPYQGKSFDFEIVEFEESVALVPIKEAISAHQAKEPADKVTMEKALNQLHEQILSLIKGDGAPYKATRAYIVKTLFPTVKAEAENASPTGGLLKDDSYRTSIRRGVDRLVELGKIIQNADESYVLATIEDVALTDANVTMILPTVMPSIIPPTESLTIEPTAKPSLDPEVEERMYRIHAETLFYAFEKMIPEYAFRKLFTR